MVVEITPRAATVFPPFPSTILSPPFPYPSSPPAHTYTYLSALLNPRDFILISRVFYGKEKKQKPNISQRLSQIMSKDGNPHLALRIQVESGGCHGFQYIMKLVTLPSSVPGVAELRRVEEEEINSEGNAEAVLRSDDTIFRYAPDDSAGPDEAGLGVPKIVLDTASLELLKGSKVDFTQELIGSQFKIVDNPFATSSCGCGTSFDIKV